MYSNDNPNSGTCTPVKQDCFKVFRPPIFLRIDTCILAPTNARTSLRLPGGNLQPGHFELFSQRLTPLFTFKDVPPPR